MYRVKSEGYQLLFTAQLFIGNDLFKVLEIPRVESEIRIPLPLARITWKDGKFTEEGCPMATITHLVFDLEVVINEGSFQILRYQYKGGS
jgi:hypothetical protein